MMDDIEMLEREMLIRLRADIETKVREKLVEWCEFVNVPLDGVEIKINWNDNKQNDVKQNDDRPNDGYEYDSA